jgi:hypothetical protein
MSGLTVAAQEFEARKADRAAGYWHVPGLGIVPRAGFYQRSPGGPPVEAVWKTVEELEREAEQT